MELLVWGKGDPLPQLLLDILMGGGMAVIPTDTLYALSVMAFSPGAVKRIYALKGRDRGKPLSLFVAGKEELDRCFFLTPIAKRLTKAYLPGPLTLVLRPKVPFPTLLLGPGGGVGVRMPNHPLPRALVEALGKPLTATSANLSGGKDPTTIAELPRELVKEVDVVVDGGKVLGVPSTVVDCTGEVLKVLREGVVSRAELGEILNG